MHSGAECLEELWTGLISDKNQVKGKMLPPPQKQKKKYVYVFFFFKDTLFFLYMPVAYLTL